MALAPSKPKPTFFGQPSVFRAWLEKHHRGADELLVGFRKRHSEKPSITWPESVDQALCFGWVDGVRRRVDDDSYTIRFTPRRPTSIWSAVNITRVAELEAQGLMRPAGLEAFRRRSQQRSRLYSYEQVKAVSLEAEHLKMLQANKKAWAFFEAQAPWYKRKAVYWVATAKQKETRLKRLKKLIEESVNGRKA